MQQSSTLDHFACSEIIKSALSLLQKTFLFCNEPSLTAACAYQCCPSEVVFHSKIKMGIDALEVILDLRAREPYNHECVTNILIPLSYAFLMYLLPVNILKFLVYV